MTEAKKICPLIAARGDMPIDECVCLENMCAFYTPIYTTEGLGGGYHCAIKLIPISRDGQLVV